jgi:hypothetical protein
MFTSLLINLLTQLKTYKETYRLELFLSIDVDKTRAYVGEQITVSYRRADKVGVWLFSKHSFPTQSLYNILKFTKQALYKEYNIDN